MPAEIAEANMTTDMVTPQYTRPNALQPRFHFIVVRRRFPAGILITMGLGEIFSIGALRVWICWRQSGRDLFGSLGQRCNGSCANAHEPFHVLCREIVGIVLEYDAHGF